MTTSSSSDMNLGDFSKLAIAYINRPGYSQNVLTIIKNHIEQTLGRAPVVADVGAGTGKLTEDLVAIGLTPTAVEPNDEMRAEGARLVTAKGVTWQAGSGEKTGLATSSADWLLMGSSFHWVKTEEGLKEFSRVLKPGGFFTAIWNPRDIESSEFHSELEKTILSMIPNVKRHSSGSGQFTLGLHVTLVKSGLFKNCIFMEDRYELEFTPERYLGAWESVNDLQAQAGPETWKKIMDHIKAQVSGMNVVKVPYKTRAWTVQKSS